MKHLRETFTENEFEALKKRKDKSKLNWHDFIMQLSKSIIVTQRCPDVGEFYPKDTQ